MIPIPHFGVYLDPEDIASIHSSMEVIWFRGKHENIFVGKVVTKNAGMYTAHFDNEREMESAVQEAAEAVRAGKL